MQIHSAGSGVSFRPSEKISVSLIFILHMSAVEFGAGNDKGSSIFYGKIYFFSNNQIIAPVNKTNFGYNCAFVFQQTENVILDSTVSKIVIYCCCYTGCGKKTQKLVHNIRCENSFSSYCFRLFKTIYFNSVMQNLQISLR